MTKAEFKESFRRLSPDDQLSLYRELGQELAAETDLRLTPELRELLEKRLAEAKANPGGGIPVEGVHARIREGFAK